MEVLFLCVLSGAFGGAYGAGAGVIRRIREKDSGQETFGMLYYAEVTSFEAELHSEIEQIIFTEKLVENWTYPEIQPKLMEEAERRGIL